MTTTSEDELPDDPATEEPTEPPVRSDVYISADIEADGPVPGRYSMLSLGMGIAGEPDAAGTVPPIQAEAARFHRELRPNSQEFEPSNPDVVRAGGLDRDRLLREGEDPVDAMTDAA